ncbi:MAG: hypothetical protein ACPGVU_26075, partial [Limisphaerales bacterium]
MNTANNNNGPRKIDVTFHSQAEQECEIRSLEDASQSSNFAGFSRFERLVLILLLTGLVIATGRNTAKGATANSLDMRLLVIAAQTNDFPLAT